MAVARRCSRSFDRYCARHRRNHPHAPLPTRWEYEHRRIRRQEAYPSSRCC
ncbi:CstA-like transporter-associated (seleno)protein [Streptomyces sp. NPDC059866]|uniref:CstA-like transporter-associated (seleno)protein n=1 Tax=Streptomyces sp. NPDC059866 TaxID=3346978 RepID=UPI003650E452